MKKTIRLALLLLVSVMLLAGCNIQISVEKPQATQPSNSECTHNFVSDITVEALPLQDGEMISTCALCGHTQTEVIPATKTLKVLAVGNSFSTDAMEYLWNICKSAGMNRIVLGNLYIGGCSIDTHYETILGNQADYTFHKNFSGKWTSTKNSTAQDAFYNEKWDIITVQQTSKTCGLVDSYSNLGPLMALIKEYCPNAKIYFHMTWAYQQDSTHASFPNYNKDQMTMYNMTVNAAQQAVLTHEDICGLIPAGTSIQNLRSSYLGDTLTRDGYHMSKDYGRYTVALTWYGYFTGGALELVNWYPDEYAYVESDIAAIRDAVDAALETPLAVTPSRYPNSPNAQ